MGGFRYSTLAEAVGAAHERFWAKVARDPETECWEWFASKNQKGYGFFTTNNRFQKLNLMAHRFSYGELVGPIPEGRQIDHLCRNRACVNPDHLEVVTPRENTLRGFAPAAHNARKTHCNYGHPFDEANTRVNARGKRFCRICDKRRERERTPRPNHKKKVAA